MGLSSICMLTRAVFPQTLRLFTSSVLFLTFLALPSFADETLKDFLQKHFPLTSAERAELQKNGVVGQILDTDRKTEVALLGIARVNVPKEFVVDKVRDITSFKKGKAVLQIGTFKDMDLKDVKTLSLEEGDVDSISECKVEDCNLKLPASWIEEYQDKADKRSKTYTADVNLLTRQLLVDYVRTYVSKGNKAMPVYESSKKHISLPDEFQDILAKSKYLSEYAPEFYQYLKEFPDISLQNTDAFFYWSMEKFGFKPVLNVTHVTIHQRTAGGEDQYLIASKQIFADHYYNGSLGLTILADDAKSPEKKGCLLVYINRSRIDALGGFLSGLRRAIAQPRIRNGMVENLKILKDRMEAEYKKLSETTDPATP